MPQRQMGHSELHGDMSPFLPVSFHSPPAMLDVGACVCRPTELASQRVAKRADDPARPRSMSPVEARS